MACDNFFALKHKANPNQRLFYLGIPYCPNYLSGLKNREERERQYFDTGLPATSSALMNEDVVEDDELYDRVS